jgi:hypothetical protein
MNTTPDFKTASFPPRILARPRSLRVRPVLATPCALVLWLACGGTVGAQTNNLKQLGLGVVPVEDGGRTGLAAGRHTARLSSDGRNHQIEIGGQRLTAALRGCPADVAQAGFDDRSRGETRPAADGSLRVVLHSNRHRGCEAHAILPAVAASPATIVPARSLAADSLPALECRGGEVVATSRTGNAYCQCPQGQGAVAVAPNRFECRHATAREPAEPGTQTRTIRATSTRTEPAGPAGPATAGTRAAPATGHQPRPPSAGPGSRPPAPPTAPRATRGTGQPADDAARTGNRAAPPPTPQGRPAQEPPAPTTSKPIPQCLATRVTATRSLAASRTGGIETARLAWELAVRTQHYASHAQWAHAREKNVDCQLAGTWTCTLSARPCRP